MTVTVAGDRAMLKSLAGGEETGVGAPPQPTKLNNPMQTMRTRIARMAGYRMRRKSANCIERFPRNRGYIRTMDIFISSPRSHRCDYHWEQHSQCQKDCPAGSTPAS